MLIPPLDPPPSYCERLSLFFLRHFLDYYGYLVRCEKDLVTVWFNSDQNNAKEGQPKFDKLRVRGLISMVKEIRKYMKY